MQRREPTTDHGLLMKGPLVRKTLAKRKWQTRRVVIRQNCRTADGRMLTKAEWTALDWGKAKAGTYPWTGLPYWEVPMRPACTRYVRLQPVVQPKHRLWVRETWRVSESTTQNEAHYRADEDEPPADGCWKPSLFMPKWACRLWLPVTGVRAERVQDISSADIVAEGIDRRTVGCDGMEPRTLTLKESWPLSWDAINGKRAPYSSNPALWVYQWDPDRIEPREVAG